jgi:hypothetical protein
MPEKRLARLRVGHGTTAQHGRAALASPSGGLQTPLGLTMKKKSAPPRFVATIIAIPVPIPLIYCAVADQTRGCVSFVSALRMPKGAMHMLLRIRLNEYAFENLPAVS